MPGRKAKAQSEYELYLQRFNAMGLELPEAATANPASVHAITSFLLKNQVFGPDEPAPEAPEARQEPGRDA